MRYFCGDVTKVQASSSAARGRKIWSNVQVNMLFENGVIGHLTGSYDAVEVTVWNGLKLSVRGEICVARRVRTPGVLPATIATGRTYAYLGEMMNFGETFESRITRWIDQTIEHADPHEIDGSGEDALKAQLIIEAAIESWESGQVVEIGGTSQ